MKKKLIGLMLEVLKIDGVIASQDCGACGILSSVSEMAHKGNCGVILNLDLVNLRQKDMTPYDILLSESQERMVIAVEDWCVDEVMALTKKHGVFASVFGETTYNNDFKVLFNNEIVANIPVNILNEPVYYKLKNIKPSYIRYVEKQKINIKLKQKTKNLDGILNENIKSIVSNVNFCSKKYVYEQYDYLVGNSTVKWPQNCGGASIIKLDENIFCGISITSNPKKVYMSPKNGTILAIMDGYRKLIASGLKPIGITDCLNFANIENSMIAYQFIQCIKGIEYISNKLKIPVVSGNVSFYNETNNSKIYPTPIFGTVGVIDKYKKIIKNHFSLDEEIFLIGNTVNFKTNTCGSLFLDIFYNFNGGKIGKVNLENDIEMCKLIFKLNEVGILKSCINVSTGGIFGAIFRGLSNNKLGFSGNLVFNNDTNIFNIQNELFGEISNVRYLVGVKDVLKLENILKKDNLPYKYLGKVVDRDFTFNGFNFDNKVFYDVFNDTLEKTMD